MKVAVLGAGAWGTAVAVSAAARHEVLLWARDPAQARALQQHRCNARYLPEVPLPASLQVGSDEGEALAHGAQGLTIIAAPMSALRERLEKFAAAASRAPAGAHRSILWLCKGFETHTGFLGHEVAAEVFGAHRTGPRFPGPAPEMAVRTVAWPVCGVLSGPSFALEVARAQPTALVVATASPPLALAVQQALHSEALRVYSSADLVGVEVGGAVKNVLAIAVGALDGLQLGLNARAALITRGLAEMTRLGVALGGQASTFMGLSGLGDLVLTATGDLSRNRRVGLLLAQGRPLAEALAMLGHVAEGVPTAPMVLARARSVGVEMPITAAVVDLLAGRTSAAEAVARLMAREARPE